MYENPCLSCPWKAFIYLLGNKKSFLVLTHCDLASFLTTFQHNKTAAKQARGLGTAALKFVFSKKAKKIDEIFTVNLTLHTM